MMSTGDTIAFLALLVSILALLVSIVVGATNLLYTRRKFTAAYHPAIRMIPHCSSGADGSYFYVMLTNLSNTVSVTNIKISYSLERLPRPRQFWRRSRFDWFTHDYPDLAPNKTVIQPNQFPKYPKDISAFAAEHYPDLVEETFKGNRTTRYRFKPSSFRLIAIVKYRPGIRSEGYSEVTGSFIVQQNGNEFSSWSIQDS